LFRLNYLEIFETDNIFHLPMCAFRFDGGYISDYY
jgi:hypothetical protein